MKKLRSKVLKRMRSSLKWYVLLAATTAEMKPEFSVFHLNKNSTEDCTDWDKT